MGIFQGEEALFFVQFHFRTCAAPPRRDAERSAVRRFAQRKTIQLGAACACGRQRQRVRACRQRPGQANARYLRLRHGRQLQHITRGKPISRGCAVCVDIAHTQIGPLQRLLQRERIGYSVSRAAWQRLAERPVPGRTAESKPHAVSARKALHRLLGAAHAVPSQPVRGTRHGKAQVVIVFGQHKSRVLRQAHFRARQRKPAVRGHGVMRAGHIMQHKILRRVCPVAAFHTDQTGVFAQRRERNVRVYAIFPFQLVPQRIAGKVRRGLPHVISAFKPYVGHIHTAAVQPGKYGKVKPDAVVCGRDMGNTAVLLLYTAPTRAEKDRGSDILFSFCSLPNGKKAARPSAGAPAGAPLRRLRARLFEKTPARLSLDSADHDALYKVFLQERIQAHDGQRSHHHSGIFQAVADDLHITRGTRHIADVALDEYFTQHHLQGIQAAVADVQQRRKPGVPLRHTVEQHHDRKNGAGKRQHDAEKR